MLFITQVENINGDNGKRNGKKMIEVTKILINKKGEPRLKKLGTM